MSLKQNIYLAGTIYNEELFKHWKERFNYHIDKDYFSTFDPEPDMEPKSFDTVAKDKQIIDRCQILVAFIARPTFGTIMEIFYAYTSKNTMVYVLDATPGHKLNEDLWLSAHTHKIFPYIDYQDVMVCAEYINENMKKYI